MVGRAKGGRYETVSHKKNPSFGTFFPFLGGPFLVALHLYKGLIKLMDSKLDNFVDFALYTRLTATRSFFEIFKNTSTSCPREKPNRGKIFSPTCPRDASILFSQLMKKQRYNLHSQPSADSRVEHIVHFSTRVPHVTLAPQPPHFQEQ